MVTYDSEPDTLGHIGKVQDLLEEFSDCLHERALAHDASKLEEPEKSAFDSIGRSRFAETYNNEEYKSALIALGDGLKHHYEVNTHHPEHWPNGINDMSLLDIIEMFCDWAVASKREDGSLARSIESSRERYGVSDQLASIFENTRKELGWI